MADESKPPHDSSDRSDATAMFFDRLDAAFAKLNTSRRTAPPFAAPSPVAAPASAVPTTGAPAAVPSSGAASGLIAEAFSALLALEDGEPGAKPVRLTTAAPEPPPEISDAVIEDIVRRVVARLGPDAVRGVVADIVSDISERLVKEEIDRIRKPNV